MYLHQRPALLDGTVEDNLRLTFALAAHRGRAFHRGRVVGLLEHVGRDTGFLAMADHDLSEGEGQIVALLRAVQLDPVVLLLDEPTASLDAAAACAVEGLVDQWYADASGRALHMGVSPTKVRELSQQIRDTPHYKRLTAKSGSQFAATFGPQDLGDSRQLACEHRLFVPGRL
jgi:ABC-type iron transport system FetAB ATPase subunit